MLLVLLSLLLFFFFKFFEPQSLKPMSNFMNSEFMTNDAKNVVYEGIVYKKGEGFITGWKER